MSIEFLSGFLGALLGAGASIGATWFITRSERENKRAEFHHAWRVEQGQELRAFQGAVIQAQDITETEVGTVGILTLDEIVKQKWLPTDSHRSIQNAGMLAIRVESESVRGCWAETEKHLRRGISNIQIAISARDRENPLVAMITDDAQNVVYEKAPDFVVQAFVEIRHARESLQALTAALDQAFQELRKA